MPKRTETTMADLLRKRSLKVTRLRLAMLAILQKAKDPVGAPEIFKAAKSAGANYVTVYRAINAMEKSGIIRRVNLRHNHNDYELQNEKDHHHLICKTCGKVEEFETCPSAEFAKRILAQSKSFASIDDHALEFFGQCKGCAKKIRSKSPHVSKSR